MSGPRFLGLRTVTDAVLVPRRDHRDRTAGAGIVRAGAAGWTRVPDSGVRRRGKEYVEPPPTSGLQPTRRIETAVFGGYVYAHFGHFLLESLGRSWFEDVDPAVPIVWIPATTDRFTPWMTELCDLVGLGRNRTVLDGGEGPVEVGELLIADQGFEVQRYLHPWFVGRLAVRDAAPAPEGSRIWLSRSGLGDLAGVEEEHLIERRLADEGWTVVHPEQLSVSEQIDVLRRATSVAGIEGSAFHALLLVRGYSGTVDLITRHGSPNFELIGRVTGWDQVRHPMPGGTPDVWHRPSGARDVRWSGVDADRAVRSVIDSSSRQDVVRSRWWRRRRAGRGA